MKQRAKETAAAPRIRSLGDGELTGELRATTDVLHNLERSALLDASPERAAVRRYREELRDLATQSARPPEAGSPNANDMRNR